MRPLILTTLIFLSLNSYGQKDTARARIQFKIIEYVNGNIYRKTLEAVDASGLAGNKIDLYFFKKQFELLITYQMNF